jgi:hypothetical protein
MIKNMYYKKSLICVNKFISAAPRPENSDLDENHWTDCQNSFSVR